MPSAPPGLSREAPSGWHEVQWVQPRSGREALLPLSAYKRTLVPFSGANVSPALS